MYGNGKNKVFPNLETPKHVHVELAKKAGIGKSSMANLLAVYRNRPDLFNGEISINKAYTQMKAEKVVPVLEHAKHLLVERPYCRFAGGGCVSPDLEERRQATSTGGTSPQLSPDLDEPITKLNRDDLKSGQKAALVIRLFYEEERQKAEGRSGTRTDLGAKLQQGGRTNEILAKKAGIGRSSMTYLIRPPRLIQRRNFG